MTPTCKECRRDVVPGYGDATASYCGSCIRNYGYGDGLQVAVNRLRLTAMRRELNRRRQGLPT